MSAPEKIIELPREQALRMVDGIDFIVDKLAKESPFDNSSVHARLILRPYAKNLRHALDEQNSKVPTEK
ncbi:MAG: hypothetical protein AAB783_02195 [Patescibacteria group bacterium]